MKSSKEDTMPNYGVIDLGSNTVRLCVYEVKDDTREHYTKKDFRTLLNNKVMAGLSAHIEDGVFTKKGIHHAIDVLKGHNKRLKYFECRQVDVFATAVLRSCTNSSQVISDIEEATGFSIRLLDEQDEAHLGFVGASCEHALDDGVLIDIGGGSTELTRIKNGKDRENSSIGLGSLASFAGYVKGILPTSKEQDSIEKAFSKKLQKQSYSRLLPEERLYGIGGSVRAAAKMYAEAFLDGSRPSVFSLDQLNDVLLLLKQDADAFAHTALKAAPERIHTLVPGCLIIKTLMEGLGARELVICGSGVREGYLIERVLLRDASAPEAS